MDWRKGKAVTGKERPRESRRTGRGFYFTEFGPTLVPSLFPHNHEPPDGRTAKPKHHEHAVRGHVWGRRVSFLFLRH